MKIVFRPDPETRHDLHMTPDGRFVEPPATPWAAKIFRWAVVVAVLAAALALAAVVLWFALILVPIAVSAALIAWAAFRWRMWRAGSRPPSHPPYRPPY
jgi:hypothetical protein